MGPGRDRTRHPWICSQDSHLLPNTLPTALRGPIINTLLINWPCSGSIFTSNSSNNDNEAMRSCSSCILAGLSWIKFKQDLENRDQYNRDQIGFSMHKHLLGSKGGVNIWPRGYKTWVQAQTQNKAPWLAACRKQPIIVLYFEFENELKFYNLRGWTFNNSLSLADVNITEIF